MNDAALVRRLLPFLGKRKRTLFFSLLAALTTVGLSLLAPLLVGRGVDLLIAGSVDFDALARVIFALLIVYLAAAATQWLLSYWTIAVTGFVVRDLRRQAYRRITRAPLSALDREQQGDLTARVAIDTEAVGDGLTQGLSQLLTGVVTIVGTMIFLFSIHWQVALTVLVLTPLSVFVARFVTSRSHHLFNEQSDIQGELSACAAENFRYHALNAAFSHEGAAAAQFDGVNERLRETGFRAQLFSAFVNPLTRFVNHLVYIAVGAVGGYMALSGAGMTVGALSACLSYANQYTKPFNEISGVIAQLQTALAALRRVCRLLDTPPETPDAPDAIIAPRGAGQVEFRRVAFGYAPGKPLIRDLSLTALPGRKIAIVGPTGAGKTTLINLLERFYDVDSGDILIDGVSVYRMTRDSLRAQFGMVLQETFLTGGSVRDNIAYGRPDASMDEVVAAARRARAHSFIKRLPNGYDTVVGDGDLSEGQKQLLCIARAMLFDAPMLILDEATSAVDTRTEQLITRAFDDMLRGRTSFVVAHRLSTVRRADVILVMRDGDIVEMGAHDDLLARGGFYRELYQSQFAKTEAADESV